MTGFGTMAGAVGEHLAASLLSYIRGLTHHGRYQFTDDGG